MIFHSFISEKYEYILDVQNKPKLTVIYIMLHVQVHQGLEARSKCPNINVKQKNKN
jgi:hypothetical protein